MSIEKLLETYHKEVGKSIGSLKKDLGKFGSDCLKNATLKYLEEYSGLDENGNKIDCERLTIRFCLTDGVVYSPELILYRYYHEGDFGDKKYRVFYKLSDGRKVVDVTNIKESHKTKQKVALILGNVMRFAVKPSNDLFTSRKEFDNDC